MKNKKITIPISECDIEQFEKLIYHNYDPFTWTFDGVDIEFIKEDEGECDENQ